MKPVKHYDVVVIGSGLGGLVSALLLAKSGKKVCVLEKNNQYGGNLQTFVRDREIFDSGVHYIGGLAYGDNLEKLFTYLGIYDDLELERMNINGFDEIAFGDECIRYPLAQGFDNFVKQLLPYFPEEHEALKKYIDTLQKYCACFQLYNLKPGLDYNLEIMQHSVTEVMDTITNNEKLKAVLLANGFLYAQHRDTPFYIHALIVTSYINSAWRCCLGGSQISKALARNIRKHGGKLQTNQEIIRLNFVDNKIASCESADTIYQAEHFLSNMCIKGLVNLFNERNRNRPSFKNIINLKDSPSVFSTHFVIKPNTIPYFNHNIYHFNSPENVFTYENNLASGQPNMALITTNAKLKNQQYASNISMMTPMDFAQVEKWKDTFNTVKNPSYREKDYEDFIAQHSAKMISILEKYFPNITSRILNTYTFTPLTYRDYIGTQNGTMYGFEKSTKNEMLTYISTKRKIKNLFLTGQNVRLHGILGVTISAFVAAGEILGRDEYINKILEKINNR